MSDAAPCTNTLVNNQHVITKVYFPRLVLPLAAGAAVVLLGGLFFFNRMESNIADRV
jgi:ABC-type polysaccharide/polyol phosphate export permease